MKKCFLIFTMLMMLGMQSKAMDYNQASTQGKTVVLYLYSTYCPACKRFSPLFDIVTSKYGDKFSFAKENCNGSEMGAKLRPDYVPVVYLIEPQKRTSQKMDYQCMTDQACFEQTLKQYSSK